MFKFRATTPAFETGIVLTGLDFFWLYSWAKINNQIEFLVVIGYFWLPYHQNFILFLKRDAVNAILNTQRNTYLAIFWESRGPTGISLLLCGFMTGIKSHNSKLTPICILWAEIIDKGVLSYLLRLVFPASLLPLDYRSCSKVNCSQAHWDVRCKESRKVEKTRLWGVVKEKGNFTTVSIYSGKIFNLSHICFWMKRRFFSEIS